MRKNKKRIPVAAVLIIAVVFIGCIGCKVIEERRMQQEEEQRRQRELLELQERENDITRSALLEQAELLFRGY